MKIDRLLGILTVLLQKERTTAPELAKKFEVNRRTIGRDIDTLCQAGIPVITYQGTGGGISIAEGFKQNRTALTTDELFNITAALKGIGSISKEVSLFRRYFNLISDDKSVLIALFDHSVKYQIIETYGNECYIETNDGLLVTINFSNNDYMLSWLLGFGEKVRVLKPDHVAEHIKTTAKKVFDYYNE